MVSNLRISEMSWSRERLEFYLQMFKLFETATLTPSHIIPYSADTRINSLFPVDHGPVHPFYLSAAPASPQFFIPCYI
jgi:hypothetical protein